MSNYLKATLSYGSFCSFRWGFSESFIVGSRLLLIDQFQCVHFRSWICTLENRLIFFYCTYSLTCTYYVSRTYCKYCLYLYLDPVFSSFLPAANPLQMLWLINVRPLRYLTISTWPSFIQIFPEWQQFYLVALTL